MLKKLATGAAFALALIPAAGFAAGGSGHVEDFQFSFEGPFGTYDQNQLQRGLQIYTEVCSACHGLKFVPLRTWLEMYSGYWPAGSPFLRQLYVLSSRTMRESDWK